MAIVDISGKKIAKTSFAKAAILSSKNGEDWDVLHPDDIPEWVKNHTVMAHLMDGEVVSMEDSGPYFYAERVN
jgi:hypothetical protein